MEHNEKIFNSLTPDILKNNKQVYTDALNHAFRNDNIRNIAITGLYGAGKSTVWNTYREHKSKLFGGVDFKNVITVCLGKYEDNSKEKKKDNFTTNGENQSNNKKEDKELDNRVERQIINQISSQIKSTDIPLSKYKFKEDIPINDLWKNVVGTMLFSISIILLIYLKPIFKYLKELFGDLWAIIAIAIIITILFILPVVYYLFNFYKENKVKFSKISFRGAEAQFTELNNDETVLERDMKEIVYLLSSSETKIVVFEDLDRYDSVDIFVKLKELNFLLNSYLETNEKNRVVRFVYLIKDSLFYSKDRTKFFDFIIPIVPVVDSRTSENYLNTMLNVKDSNNDNDLSKKTIWNVSLYIDDMRVLRNIVNEYKVYSEIVPVSDLELDENKLFALITLKNIYPNEFDLLQQDKGFIKEIFNKVIEYKYKLVNKFQAQLEEKNKNLIEINKAKKIFERMSLCITQDVVIDGGNYIGTWAELLENWYENPGIKYNISSANMKGSYNYDDFVEKFVYTSEMNKKEIEDLWEIKRIDLNELLEEIIKLRRKIDEVKVSQIKEIISEMNSAEIDDLFEEKREHILSHKYPLIRFLIIEGLLNETYWLYKGNFDINKSNVLKQNDTIFMKGLLEKEEPNIFLELESPEEIMNRLELDDFRKFSILNSDLLEACVKNNQEKKVLNMLQAVENYQLYTDFVRIINEIPSNITDYLVDKMIQHKNGMIVKILKECKSDYDIALKNITLAIVMNENATDTKVKSYKEYIEANEELITWVKRDRFDEFIQRLCEKNIKFNNFQNIEGTNEVAVNELLENGEESFSKKDLRNRLIQIEKNLLYKINIDNVLFLAESVLNRKINYGHLFSVVFEEKELISSKKYVEDNFVIFFIQYLDGNNNDEEFTNGEAVFLKILNLELGIEEKIQYINKTKIKIKDLRNLNKVSDIIEIVQELFKNKQVEINAENLNYYWNTIQESDKKNSELEEAVDKFVGTMNSIISGRLIKHNKTNDIKLKNSIFSKCEAICNELINISTVSDTLFKIIINHAQQPIAQLNSNLSDDRIKVLIKENKILPNEDNIKIIIDKSLDEEIKTLAETNEKEVLPLLIKMELSDETIYSVVNSNVSTDNAKSLLTKLNGSVQIDKINPEKTELIESIQNENL